MPELPEVETTLRGIKPFVINQEIKEIITRHKGLRWPFPANLNALMKGQKVNKASRRGKYLLLETSKGTLILHLGMSGSLQILTEKIDPKKHDHVDIIFTNGTILRFRDPRRFGALLLAEGDPFQHTLLSSLGPEPLSKNFTGEYLFQRSRGRKVAVKTFLMDSKTVVGVGNIYATEALFLAKINPKKFAGTLSQKQCTDLVTASQEVLKAAIKQGGTTLKDFVNSKGKKGYFFLRLKVYGREGKPCVVCKTPLKMARIGQRRSVYCVKCQK